jgi:phage head maturation protease
VKHVLFLCNHDAGRSQMAQTLFERLAPAGLRVRLLLDTKLEEIRSEARRCLRAERCDLLEAMP